MKPQVDPKIAFYIGGITTIALLLAQASLWADAIPAAAIPAVVAWSKIIGTIGNGLMTILAGLASNQHGEGVITKMLKSKE
jgi:hypothetical protein